MSVTNDEIVEKIRDLRKTSGKTQQDLADLLGKTSASISDLERGKVQISAAELSLIADFLNVSINNFYQKSADDEYMLGLISAIRDEPKEARMNSFEMVKLYIEIQSLAKKLLSKPDKKQSPEELGEIVTKLLSFQAQYKTMTSKLDAVVADLLGVLKENDILLPKTINLKSSDEELNEDIVKSFNTGKDSKF